MSSYLLWDVDGTLLKNKSRASVLYDEAITQVTGFVPDTPGQGEHGKTDGQIIAERLAQYGIDPELHGQISARLDELSIAANSGPNRRELLAGVPEALAAVRDAGWTNALLTGNSITRARAKLVGAGLDEGDFDWEHSFFGDRSRKRSDVTLAAAEALGDLPRVIVGDTPNDGHAATAANIPFVAVATGIFPPSELHDADALEILDDLPSGLPRLLAVLARLDGSATADR